MANIINVGTSANDGTGDTLRDACIKINSDNPENLIVVKSASDFGVIDSTKQYILGGNIDMGTTSIDLSGGKDISIRGADFNVSGLFSTEDNYTLFTGSDAGNVNLFDIGIDISGANSNVYELTGNTGFEAIEVSRVNYNNCTSLGYLDNYRQGLEVGTGRFGGTPSLEFRGSWVGGYRITTSIVRSLTNSVFSLFKCAIGQTFNSRFGGNPNVDLPANVTFLEATETNFNNDNSVQLQDALFSGDGSVFNGLNETNKKVRVSNTGGIQNTYVGGFWSLTAESTTLILLANTYVKLAGTTTYNGLTWFSDGGGDNSLTYDSTEPIKVKTEFVGSFTGSNNRSFSIRFRVWDNSASAYIDYAETTFTTNGGILSDRAESVVLISPFIEINQNDRIEVWIENNTDVTDVTALLNSRLIVEELKS